MKKITEMISKYINVIIFALTIFIALGMNIGFVKDTNYLGFNSSDYTIFYLMEAAGVAVLLYYSFKIKDKRLWRCTSALAFIFAVCYLLGDLGNTYVNTTMPNSKKFVLYIIIKIFTYFILFNSGLVVLFNKIPAVSKVWAEKSKEYKFFTANKKSFFVIALIFFISYIPYFLYYYPGLIQDDSINCLEQIIGLRKINNYNPILYTGLLGGIWSLGRLIFNSGNAGIAMYTLFQMLITSMCFSFILYYMARKNVALKWRIITLLFLLLNPLNGLFAVRVEKSLFFTLAFMMTVIGIIELISEGKEFFDKKKKIIMLMLIILLTLLLRHNAVYVFILVIPFILVISKGYRKKILMTFCTPIIAYLIFQNILINVFNVIPGREAEMFSIPMQQFARLVKYENNNLTDREKETIHNFIPTTDEDISNRYDPIISDMIKFIFSDEYVRNHKTELIQLYFELAIKYPGQTFSSILFNTYGYYAPNSYNIWGTPNYIAETERVLKNTALTYWYSDSEIVENPPTTTNSEKYDIHPKQIINFSVINSINNYITTKSLPIFSSLMTSIGLYFWIILMGITYSVYIRKYKLIITFLPIIFLLLTLIAGPVVEIRYIYSMILLTPVYMGVIVFKENKLKERDEK